MLNYLIDRLFVWLSSTLDKTPDNWFAYSEFKYGCNVCLNKVQKIMFLIHNCYQYFPLSIFNSYTSWHGKNITSLIKLKQNHAYLKLFQEMLILNPHTSSVHTLLKLVFSTAFSNWNVTSVVTWLTNVS